MPVIGFLNSATPEGFSGYMRALRQGLKESGYVEGENLAIEYRWAENQAERLPELAADLVRRQVKVIAAIPPLRWPRVKPPRRSRSCSASPKTRSGLA
jgi:putative tryptophan/tyrosine transport system substrate-binding protein